MTSPLQDVIRQAAARVVPPIPSPPPRAVPPSPGIVASLKLAAIGDHYRALQRRLGPMGLIHRVHHRHIYRVLMAGPWVARITGRDVTYGLARTFIQPLRDYRDASSSGKTGVVLVFMLPEGVYEVHEWLSYTKDRRYFVRSAAGKLAELSSEELEAWLSRPGAAP